MRARGYYRDSRAENVWYLQKYANGQSSSVYKKRQIQRYDNVVISTLNDLSNKNLSMMCFIPYGILCLSNGVHSERFGE